MLQFVQKIRFSLAFFLSGCALNWLAARYPFPRLTQNVLLHSIYHHSPAAYWTFKIGWAVTLFGVPFLYLFYPILANLRRFSTSPAGPQLGVLPPYPDIARREQLSVVLGEVHHPDRLEPSPRPTWLNIPQEGLCLGVLAMGAPGTGKSAGVVLPAAEQLLAYKADDSEKRLGGLVLEVKGDFCHQIGQVLAYHNRGEDYLELGLNSEYCYNPLHNNASPTALAFHLIALMKTLHGESKEPFWEQAAESLVTFLILVYRLLHNYVTLFDIYRASSDITVVDELMKRAAESLKATNIVLDKFVFLKLPDDVAPRVNEYQWDAAPPHHLRTPADDALRKFLLDHEVPHEIEVSSESVDHAERLAQFQTATRYYKKLKNLDKKLQGNIAEGINVFLMVTDVDPAMRRIFCPPKEAYDVTLNRDFRYGRPLPPLDKLIETPTVLALNLPIAADESLARLIGTLLKQDWQRAVLQRIPRMQADPTKHYRELALLIDEYHLLATAGGSRPIGDEKFLNLCRAARCIPIVAFQSLSSLKDTVPADTWRTIIAAFATTIILRQKDLFTAEIVSKMCGRVDVFKEHYGFTEGGHDAKVSLVTGRTTAPRSSINMSHSYNLTREYLKEPKDIMELPRGVGIVLANNGDEQLPPTFCYLTPHGEDPKVSYWSKRGRLDRFAEGG